MIREKSKKVDKKLDLQKELISYVRTIIITFFIGTIIAILLSFHARSEMIKNLYESKEEKSIIEKQIAQQIVSKTDFIKSLNGKNYAICMKVGQLYEMAGDYQKAEYVYHLALQKAKNRVYTPYYKLVIVYIAQNKIDDAEKLISEVPDTNELSLIRFKTRSYIVLGDKYNSENKYLKAAEKYEKAIYYYSRLQKPDKVILESIKKRLINTYKDAASILVKNGYNSDAVRFLQKALRYNKNNNDIKYRLAIIYSDLDPIKSVEYFEKLVKQIPQNIDYNIYAQALMKSANIEDLNGNGIKAKYYRYKVHSLELFINNKVIYKDDIDVFFESFELKKILFKYRFKAKFRFRNNSANTIFKMTIEFVLRQGNKVKEKYIINNVNRNNPFVSNGGELKDIIIQMGKNIYTKRELDKYYLDIYMYKDPQYKTLISTIKLPNKDFNE